MNYRWKTKTGQYQIGEYLYLNNILIGEWAWNSLRPKGSTEADHYTGRIFLPSLKNKRVSADTIEEVKAKMEKIANAWFAEALAKVEGG